jgi:hypothetical protein
VSDDNERSVPDLGFFAAPGGTTQFGGSQFGGSQFGGSQFGGAPATQFGGAPATQFGGPAPFGAPAPFGTPAPAAAPYRSRNPNRSPALLAAAVAVIIVLVAAVIGGRFVWWQFMDSPVAPPTLLGMPRADAAVTAELETVREAVLTDMTSDGEAEVGFYTDGLGTAYLLLAVRGGSASSTTDDELDSSMTWTESEHNGAQCRTATGPGGVALYSFCLQGKWRRAVGVIGIGVTDPATVARATNEAWTAQ